MHGSACEQRKVDTEILQEVRSTDLVMEDIQVKSTDFAVKDRNIAIQILTWLVGKEQEEFQEVGHWHHRPIFNKLRGENYWIFQLRCY